MNYDWRLAIAAIAIPSSFAAGYYMIEAMILREHDWRVNGDPCEQARENGIHFGFCNPTIPDTERYLGYAWIGLVALAFLLVTWTFFRPKK